MSELGMSPVETAVSMAFGYDEPVPARAAQSGAAPLAALENALLPSLRRAPCVVSFSGGRDSSLVLAAAARAARSAGLAPPIAVTVRFAGFPATEEARWQERVLRHVGVDEWVRIDLDGELDLLGQLARDALLAHGPLFPPNAHFLLPLLHTCPGGSLVVGLGGDEIFGQWAWRRLGDVLARRARPRPRDAGLAAVATLPRPVRRRVFEHRTPGPGLGWLRPAANRELARLRAWERNEPVRWDRAVRCMARRRDVTLGARTLERLGAAAGVAVHAPLLDAGFVTALAQAGGRTGWGGRTAVMRAAFADALPDDVLTRRDKAVFGDIFWRAEARAFADRWSGSGLDGEIVDADALRDAWRAPHADHRTSMLLHAAWLHDERQAAA